MEDYIWELVELWLAGAADRSKISELQSLLSLYPSVYVKVREFLMTYQDPEPRISTKAIQQFLTDTNKLLKPSVKEAQKERILMQLGREVAMAGQFFKIAVRNLVRHRTISMINITGLAIGVASAVLILLWVQNQLSYDQFHQNKDRVYQVYNRASANGSLQAWSTTPMPLGPAIKSDYAQVEYAVRTCWVGSFVLKHGENKLESQGLTTDPGFLQAFTFPLLEGNAATALNGTHSIVLTHTLAKKLFGNADPIGQVMAIDSNANFTVTGVLKDLPHNTAFNFEYLVPFSYMKEVGWYTARWDYFNTQTYIMVRPGISETLVNNLLKNMYHRYHGQAATDLFAHPMAKWWLYSRYDNGHFTGGQINVVHLFMAIAMLIVAIACINYMNLGTARSARRAKEVGVRKVAGAGRIWLIKQFLGESVLVALVAGVLSLVVVQLALPWFCMVTGSTLQVPYDSARFWLAGFALLVFTGILAGSYPAFYLSGFKPINVLKGSFQSIGTLLTLRKTLVVLQFTFAIVFIISTAVVYQQIRLAQTRNTGYRTENMIFVYLKGDMAKHYDAMRNQLLGSGAVTDITRSSSPIQENWNNHNGYQWVGKSSNTNISFDENSTDRDFTSTFGLPLISGRDINITQFPSDTAALLLTREAARTMGFENPVGQIIRGPAGNLLHVVGVTENYVAVSPFIKSLPIIIHGASQQFGTITMRMNPSRTKAENLTAIYAILKKNNPAYPANINFMDEAYRDKFKNERYQGQMVAVFAGLSIFICCLGLFALAATMAESRVKEIGIRKVLGASAARITTLLTKDFVILVLIAFVIASPMAWWLMSRWLEDYPYRIRLGWQLFAVTGGSAIAIAYLTVGYQAIRAAFGNPVNSLRSE